MKIINKTDKNRCNCVLWLRDRLPELPYGLWTLDDKKKIINSTKPVVGAGAISKDGTWFTHKAHIVWSGHVALVTKVKDDKITIREANFKPCTITERTGTMEELNLIGFFVPNYKEEKMSKKIMEALSDIVGRDLGSKLNEKEEKEVIKALSELQNSPDSNEKLEDMVRVLEQENKALEEKLNKIKEIL